MNSYRDGLYGRGWILAKLIVMVGVDSCQVDYSGREWILARLIAMAGSGFVQGWVVWQGMDSYHVDCYGRG